MSSNTDIKENETDKAVKTRYSCNKFSEKPIEKGLLEHILQLTQRTPTSCNLQSYKIITVRNPELIEKIREAHHPSNHKISMNAIPVIFLSDLQPSYSLPEFAELNKDSDHLEGLMSFVNAFMSYLMRERWFHFYKTPISAVARIQMNVPGSMTAFSFGEKTVGLVVGTFVTLCASHGIDTHIMEAFADWKIQKILNIPSRYQPSTVVWCGYRDEEPTKQSVRYSSDYILYEDTFGNPLIK